MRNYKNFFIINVNGKDVATYKGIGKGFKVNSEILSDKTSRLFKIIKNKFNIKFD
jgi:hypothetical protein